MREKPLMSFHVVQPWLQSRACAVRLYGDTGAEAWARSCMNLKDSTSFALAVIALKTC
jgi:hypothetical protein